MEFNVFLWVTDFDEKFLDTVAVVALQHYLSVLAGAAASAISFEFLCDALQVIVFIVHTVDYGSFFSKFTGFKPDANTLLLFFYFSTNA